MPVVPFSRNPQDAVPEDLRPSDTHLMMAAAVMQEMKQQKDVKGEKK